MYPVLKPSRIEFHTLQESNQNFTYKTQQLTQDNVMFQIRLYKGTCQALSVSNKGVFLAICKHHMHNWVCETLNSNGITIETPGAKENPKTGS